MTKLKAKPEIKISDILHLAADKYLANGPSNYYSGTSKERFSCCAIENALADLYGSMAGGPYDALFDGLENMGCDISSTMSFAELENPVYPCLTKESQEARYFWLKWAALMAAEQGQ